MKKATYGILGALAVLGFIAGCGTDFEKGKAALEKKDLATAKAMLEKALKSEPESLPIKEALVKTYALRALEFGKKNPKRGRLIIDKAAEQFDPQMSQDVKDAMCDYWVAAAGQLVEDGKEGKALEKLEHANTSYGPNEKVTAEYDKVRVKYAKHMFEEGTTRYQQYLKRKDDMKLLYAEKFLTYALKYDDTIKEADKLVKKIRKKTLNMADPDARIPMAVIKLIRKAKSTNVGVYIKSNHVKVQVVTDPQNFILVDADGNEHKVDDKLMAKVNALQKKILKSPDEAEGFLAYAVPRKTKLLKLIYREGEHEIEKYFP